MHSAAPSMTMPCRDGERHNLTWNCGAEGPTSDGNVLDLRSRQVSNVRLAPPYWLLAARADSQWAQRNLQIYLTAAVHLSNMPVFKGAAVSC